MPSRHPAFDAVQSPGSDSFAGYLMLRIAAATELIPLQEQIVALVTSGEAARRFGGAADGDTARGGAESDVPAATSDVDETLLLLHELVRAHDDSVGEPTDDHAAVTRACEELQAEQGVLTVEATWDRRGAFAVADTLLAVIPGSVGALTVERESRESAVLTGELVMGIRGAAAGTEELLAETAVAVFQAQGLTARHGDGPGAAVILDGLCFAAPLDEEGTNTRCHMRGPRFDVIQPQDVSVETFLRLLSECGTGDTECGTGDRSERTGEGRSSAEACVRVWNGFGWLLEADADSVRFRHVRSPWERSAPRGDDEELSHLVGALLAGDIPVIRDSVWASDSTSGLSWTRSRRWLPDIAPGGTLHPSFGTVYPPDGRSAAGELMLMVATGLGRSYSELQDEAVARAAHHHLTPEQSLMLLDDVVDQYDEAVGMRLIDFFRLAGALVNAPQAGLAAGLPTKQTPGGYESAVRSMQSDPASRGCFWVEAPDLEQAVLTRALPLSFRARTQDAAGDAAVGSALVDYFRSEGLDVRWDGSAASRIILEPLDWSLSVDTDTGAESRQLRGPGVERADEDVTTDAVMDAARPAIRSTSSRSRSGRSTPGRATEVWTGQGWQLDITSHFVQLTHRSSPRLHQLTTPPEPVLRTLVDDLLTGAIPRLLAHDWEVREPGALGRRRLGARGPNTRMHPVMTLPYPQDEDSFSGALLQHIAVGISDAPELRHHMAAILLWDPESVLTGTIPTVEEGILLLDEIIEHYNAEARQADSSAQALDIAEGILAERGIALALGAADLTDGHQAGEERARQIWADNPAAARGYAFCHDQDLLRAAYGGELLVGFGALPAAAGTSSARTSLGPAADEAIAAEVVAALREAGLTVEWDGSAGSRILVTPIAWVREVADSPREPELSGRWGNEYWSDEVTVTAVLHEVDQLGGVDDVERSSVELRWGTGWELVIDPEVIEFGHHDTPTFLTAPTPGPADLAALTRELLEGDIRAVLARDWTRRMTGDETPFDAVDATASASASASATDAGTEPDEPGRTDQRSFSVTDRWGAQTEAPDPWVLLDLFRRCYAALHDDGADLEHTVVSVESSDGWFLEFSAESVTLDSVEEDDRELAATLWDAEVAASLVQVFATEGTGAAAGLVRLGHLGRKAR